MRSRIRPALLALTLAGAAPLAAQPPAAGPAPVATVAPAADTATLIVRNRRVITFRAPYLGRSAAVRAAGATERIRQLLSDGRLADTVAVIELAEGYAVLIGDRPIFAVTAGDVDPLVEADLGATAREAGLRLSEGWAALGEERSAGRLVRSAARALGVTFVFFLLITGLRRLTRRLRARAAATMEQRTRDLQVAGVTVLPAGFLRTAATRAVLGLGWVVGVIAAYLWLTFVLEQFPWTRPAGAALGGFLVRTIEGLLAGMAAAIPGLLVVVIIFAFTRWLSRVVRGFFLAVEGRRAEVPWLHAEIAEPTRRLVGALIWIFALVAAYPYLPGSESDVFKGLSVLVGLMLSLGSGSLIGQAMSGLALMYSRALRVGDVVRIDDAEGVVQSLGMFSTKLMTPRGEEITIPNGVVLGTKTVNLSRFGVEAPLSTSVTIGYDTPWRQVEAMLLEAARRTPGVVAQPAPVVLMRSLGDFAVVYELRAAPTAPRDRVAVLSVLHGQVLDVFNEHGVQIMTPSYEGDPAAPKVVPRDRWHEAPAAPGSPGGD